MAWLAIMTKKKVSQSKHSENIDPKLKEKAEEKVQGINDVQVLKEKRDEYNTRTKNLIQERRRLDEDIKLNKNRAIEYRQKRDELNEEVKKLKEKKSKIFDQLNSIKEELKAVRAKDEEERKSKGNSGKGKKKGISLKKLNSQITQLEKKIITETLDLKEENDIIQEIQKLELLKSEMDVKTGGSGASKKLMKEISALKQEIGIISTEIQNLSEESQNYHVLMKEIFKESDMKRDELSNVKNDLTESKVIADEFHNKFKTLGARKPRRMSRSAGAQIHKKMKKQIQEATLQDALDKKKKGKKLNIFEARALFENASSSNQENNK